MTAKRRKALRREPRGPERFMDLEAMRRTFDNAGPTMLAEADTALRIAAADLVHVAKRGAAEGRRDSAAAWQPSGELAETLGRTFQRYIDAGRQQVSSELEAQRVTTGRQRLSEPDDESDEEGTAAATAYAAALAALAATMIADQMRSVVRLSRGIEGRTRQELESMALREGAAETLRWSVHVSRLVNFGRAAEARAHESDIEDAVYSAILDANTCEECEAMDGEVTADLDRAAGWTPNPACHGGTRCRCVTVYQYRQEPAGR